MKAHKERRATTVNYSSMADLTFAAGSFEFAHWLSNIGAGPKTIYAGAYAVTHQGTRHLAYSLNLRNTFDSERDYMRGTLDDAVRAPQRVATAARLGFPSVSLTELATRADVPGLRRNEAIAATQATIWMLTGDFLFAGLLDADFAATARVLGVMDYLLAAAESTKASAPGTIAVPPPEALEAGMILGLVRADQTQSVVHPLILSGTDTSDIAPIGLRYADEFDRLDEAV